MKVGWGREFWPTEFPSLLAPSSFFLLRALGYGVTWLATGLTVVHVDALLSEPAVPVVLVVASAGLGHAVQAWSRLLWCQQCQVKQPFLWIGSVVHC